MLANTRFRTFALVALPCVVFIYLLQRGSVGGATNVIEGFHHYTHKLVDLDAIKAVQDYTQKLGEALPWKSQGHSEADSTHIGSSHEPPSPSPSPSPSSSPSTTSALSESLPDTTSLLSNTLPSQAAELSESTGLNLTHLQDLCHETNWTQGLWLQCHSYCGPTQTAWCGGLNNARNRFQTCLRLAIDAGAGLIIPQIFLRGVGAASVSVFGEESCSDYWFDLAHLERTMRTNCPQLNLRAACEDAADNSTALAPPPETELEVLETPHRHISDPQFATGDFRQHLVLPNLQNSLRFNESSGELEDGTTIIKFGDSFTAWDYGISNELSTVRKDLYKAVRFRESMNQIGEKIRDSPQLQHGSYIAVHLRGEIDWPIEWGSADQQMAMYMDEMADIRATDEGRNVSAVFVSSGEQEVIQVFRDMLQPLNYTVHDKWTVLADALDDIAALQQADFDSMGIVDNAVLAGAKYFMGIWMSTFSQNVAFARTINDDEDFLNSVIFRNGVEHPDNTYTFAEPLSLQGNNFTKLIVRDGLGITVHSP